MVTVSNLPIFLRRVLPPSSPATPCVILSPEPPCAGVPFSPPSPFSQPYRSPPPAASMSASPSTHSTGTPASAPPSTAPASPPSGSPVSSTATGITPHSASKPGRPYPRSRPEGRSAARPSRPPRRLPQRGEQHRTFLSGGDACYASQSAATQWVVRKEVPGTFTGLSALRRRIFTQIGLTPHVEEVRPVVCSLLRDACLVLLWLWNISPRPGPSPSAAAPGAANAPSVPWVPKSWNTATRRERTSPEATASPLVRSPLVLSKRSLQ